MKVGLIVPGFSSGEDDWCIPALLDYVRVLAERAEVHVFSLRWPERRGTYDVFGARVHSLGGHGHRGARTIGLWAAAARSIAAEHDHGPFDVLHALWADEPGWIAAWSGRQLGLRPVISFAGGELVARRDLGYGTLLHPGRILLIRRALREAGCVTAGSRYLMGIAAPHLPQERRDRLKLAPFGVDTDLFAPATSPSPRAPTFLNVGSLVPVKGQAALLRAFARMEIPDARLRLAGAGPLERKLRSQAAALGIAERVEFLGAVDHGRMPEVYRAADVFTQASHHEAQGMAVLEAAACGLPVVGTAVGVLPEIGRAVPAGDEEALARAMRETLSERRTETRDRIQAEFSLGAAVERFETIYRSVR